MPTAWTNKRERQYEHIKKSEIESGAPQKLAKEVAARTVNKQRREAGETPNKTTQGTGNPNVPLEEHSRQELYNQARQMKISGRSKLSKSELAQAIRRTSH